ncbi:MAG TPA: hypothetical protein PKX99_00465 [Thermoanaerobaculia bacterium]|jgi:hypothetical protein|nr:hypothetical protein [Acidobacteriota bacterium]OQC42573.1 MAG: hypothetical protein BWX64_00080 [Acidobacteria bacterium ADurb.Bin051]HPA95735.1 hypothetical protein [Thermoanaerobaculia bacterium]HPK65027.1 hypothetical protein [Thermoanaerobaculia bacterium]HRS36362.1 hypothetical protein [Thermoanaerobaculia bacterium]
MMASSLLTPRCYARLLALLGGTAVLLAALGLLPTVRLAGRPGVAAMATGIGVSLFATGVGVLPLVVRWRHGARTSALLATMVLRFLLVGILTLVLVLSGLLPKAPVLIWIALSYLVMLAAEATYTARQLTVAGKPGG